MNPAALFWILGTMTAFALRGTVIAAVVMISLMLFQIDKEFKSHKKWVEINSTPYKKRCSSCSREEAICRAHQRIIKSFKGAKVVRDVRFKHKGKSFQIDMIMVVKEGLFVINFYNYYAEIHGDDMDEHWTVQYSDLDKYQSRNLYMKLEKDSGMLVDALYERCPSIGVVPINNLVVFTGYSPLQYPTGRKHTG